MTTINTALSKKKKDYSKKLTIVRAHQGTWKPAERAPNGQNLNNSSKEVILDYNPKYKYLLVHSDVRKKERK